MPNAIVLCIELKPFGNHDGDSLGFIELLEGHFVGKKAGMLAPEFCSACASFSSVVMALGGEETHTLPAQLPFFSCERKTDRVVALACGILDTMLDCSLVVMVERKKSSKASSRSMVGQGHSQRRSCDSIKADHDQK